VRISRVFILGFLASLAATVAGAFAALMLGPALPMVGDYWALGFVAAGVFLVAAGAAKVYERGRWRIAMFCSIVFSFLAAGGWCIVATGVLGWDETSQVFSAAISVPGIASVGAMFSGLMALPVFRTAAPRTIRALSIAAMFAATAGAEAWMLAAVWAELTRSYTSYDQYYHAWAVVEGFGRLFAVLVILAAGGLVATFVLSSVRQLTGEEIPESDRRRFTIECPRCGSSQSLRTSGDACSRCDLRISVTPQ
jgi:hypothetical protein